MKLRLVVIGAILLLAQQFSFAQGGGENCANAETLTCGQTVSGFTLGVTPDGFDSGNFEGTNGQRWYQYTSPGTGTAEFGLCSNNTNYDTYVHVYSGDCGSLTFLTLDDDACVNPIFASDVVFPVTTGVTYFIRVGGLFTNAGTFEGTFTCNITITGCTDPLACNYSNIANFDDGSCEYVSCYGCTYATALNYNPTATFDNGSCLFQLVQPGCTNPAACNYCTQCTVDNGSCDFTCFGCTYPAATNYNAAATRDDGSCVYSGCTNPAAYNYNPLATIDDGTCDVIGSCLGDMNQDGTVDVNDVLLFIQTFGTFCN